MYAVSALIDKGGARKNTLRRDTPARLFHACGHVPLIRQRHAQVATVFEATTRFRPR